VPGGGNPTTWGPLFSRTLAEHIKREIGFGVDDVQPLLDDDGYGALLATAHATDVMAWLGAKLFLIVMGPAAEARFVERPFEEIWWEAPAAGDRGATVWHARLAGLGDAPEEYERTMKTVAEQAKAAIDNRQSGPPSPPGRGGCRQSVASQGASDSDYPPRIGAAGMKVRPDRPPRDLQRQQAAGPALAAGVSGPGRRALGSGFRTVQRRVMIERSGELGRAAGDRPGPRPAHA